jgi:hypothetical protein
MMLGNGSVESGERFSPTWDCDEEWQVVDRALRAIAGERAALDAKEARWLREGVELKIWKRFGMVDMIDYMERRMGYTPHVGKERLRVAHALGDLPAIEEALRDGELSFSAVRELTRVATPETEEEWLDTAADKNVRQIEELVSGHRPGDKPTDPADPRVRIHRVVLELNADAYAGFRQARAVLQDEHGRRLDDSEIAAAWTGRVLEGSAAPSGRARAQIAITVCEKCRAATQDGAGATVAINAAALARAECDAQYIGSLDAAEPARAYQDVSPAVARLVWRRDHGRCRVPGGRSARALEIHHIIHREHGGSHEPWNLVLLCSSCHTAHHEGRLVISGTSEALEVRRPHGTHDALDVR